VFLTGLQQSLIHCQSLVSLLVAAVEVAQPAHFRSLQPVSAMASEQAQANAVLDEATGNNSSLPSAAVQTAISGLRLMTWAVLPKASELVSTGTNNSIFFHPVGQFAIARLTYGCLCGYLRTHQRSTGNRLTVGGDRLDYLVTTLRQHDHHQVPPQYHLPPDARFMCWTSKFYYGTLHGNAGVHALYAWKSSRGDNRAVQPAS
jgi:hypothetical protein